MSEENKPGAPREWCLWFGEEEGGIWCGTPSDYVVRDGINLVHVIEFSAYEKLSAENEALKKERTAYRTLNAIAGDCAEKVELHDEIETLEAVRDRLTARVAELKKALQGILEIGKRDMSNSKYDGYFDDARAALSKKAGGE